MRSSSAIALSAAGSSGRSPAAAGGGACIAGEGLRPSPFSPPATCSPFHPGSRAAVPPRACLSTARQTAEGASPDSRAAWAREAPSATRLTACSLVRTGWES